VALGVFLKVRRSRVMEARNLERLFFRRVVDARFKPVNFGVNTSGRVKSTVGGVVVFLRRMGPCDGGTVGGGDRIACRDWDLVVRRMMDEGFERRDEAWKLVRIYVKDAYGPCCLIKVYFRQYIADWFLKSISSFRRLAIIHSKFTGFGICRKKKIDWSYQLELLCVQRMLFGNTCLVNVVLMRSFRASDLACRAPYRACLSIPAILPTLLLPRLPASTLL
jgi:hypothetical protein